MGDWTIKAGSLFQTEKQPALGSTGTVVTNHPLASAAGAEMLAAGGNAVDAAVAALFALSVVEPMMVGIFGGGLANIRLPDGTQTILEGQVRCPAAVGPTTFSPDPMAAPGSMDAIGRANSVGRSAVGIPGNLMAWCQMLSRWGRMSLADVVEPAIRHAQRGFAASRYLARCVADCAADLAADPEIASVFMPRGVPLAAATRVTNGAYAQTLKSIVSQGPEVLYGGALGAQVAQDMSQRGGFITLEDLRGYRTQDLEPLRFTYRGFEITGPPPPSAGPLHIGQMLAILEAVDIGASGFGSVQTIHWIAEALKIAFADRAASTADPDYVAVPVEQVLDRGYAAQRRAQIDPSRAGQFHAGVARFEGAHTTHVTVADREGFIVSATQTINSLFGARFMVPDTGIIANNYLYVFDPRPGRAHSLAPGKRVISSMSPLILFKDGRPVYALGLPGGLRIFPSALQAVLNLVDHGMSLQQTVEAPRVWTQGYELELEAGIAADVAAALSERGHSVLTVPNVGGGMNAIQFLEDGSMLGAACWRADGVAIGVGGGAARDGVSFLPEARKR
jgi:gamma-glutamyltranspeptidase/glutathione hydrolase